jgi:hypothetical protein
MRRSGWSGERQVQTRLRWRWMWDFRAFITLASLGALCLLIVGSPAVGVSSAVGWRWHLVQGGYGLVLLLAGLSWIARPAIKVEKDGKQG